MSKNLVIVESPAKAKTIEKFLGSEFKVLSSQGHIRDIESQGGNNMGIDFEHNYAPHYGIDKTKEALIATLRSESKKADTVWLASDEDREGEAIAWHLKEVLELDSKKTKRIVFHEITKNAILNAIENPRDIDYQLVHAQQARRVLDRIVGFDLSPILWKKITTDLSAGRVQSVAVRLIVDREKEIENFKTSYNYRVVAEFTGSNPGDASILRAELDKPFANKKLAMDFLELCQKSLFKVAEVNKRPGRHTPAPPFTTSSLQQEAARKLKFPVSKTMRLAQSLYEAGKITYMRTDSVNLSSLALATCKEEVIKMYGEKYHHMHQYTTTSKGAQEAHEAIRPTYISEHTAGENPDEQKLYELIWKRTIASQMADAELETTHITVNMTGSQHLFIAQGEVVVFDGFMRAYVQSVDDAEESGTTLLPMMAVQERLRLRSANAVQSYKKAPYRYNEATLVKEMESLGIGRPSTYATIIETILSRHYVERGSFPGTKRNYTVLTLQNGKVVEKQKSEQADVDLQKLFPTDLGRFTTDFLVATFPNILSNDFTAKEEEAFDLIAAGKEDWVKTVDDFYKEFHPIIEHVEPGKLKGILYGTDPKTGGEVRGKVTKGGSCVQLSTDEKSKPVFASLKKGQSIYKLTLTEALEALNKRLPVSKIIDGEAIELNEGKYGPFIKTAKGYISLPKNTDLYELKDEDIRSFMAKQAENSAPIQDWGDIQVLNGRYGLYIKTKEGNYRLPKGVDPQKLTKEECLSLILKSKEEPKEPKKHYFKRKSAK